ncbi:911_t:CDS:2, partial [Entrophospora sp. SA101]
HRTLEDAKQVAHNRNEAKQITYSKNGNCLSEKCVNCQKLDTYYPEYGLAIEVQEQHERYVELFHRDQNGFNKQLYWDQLKKEFCEEN